MLKNIMQFGIMKRRGSILVMMMVILGMFMVITVAVIGFINRQFHALSQQEQEEQAFHAAEAGLHYGLFLINKGVFTTEELIAGGPVSRTVTAGGSDVGSFTLRFNMVAGADPGQGVEIVAEGHDNSLLNICQTIVAKVSHAGSGYAVTHWDHAVPCGGYEP